MQVKLSRVFYNRLFTVYCTVAGIRNLMKYSSKVLSKIKAKILEWV